MNYDFEIGIIGGGPAGSTAAAYLADYGFDVCLFEKKSFPRETLCGEFLSSEVIYFLNEMNLFEEFISLHPNKINSFRIFDDSGKNAGGKFNFNAYGLSRLFFDNLLLCNVIKKGVKVFQPAEVKEILPKEKSFQLILKTEEQNGTKINVRYLIAAYGKQNPLDNSLNRNFINYRSKLNGIKFHLRENKLNDFDKDEIHIYAADRIYCGVNAVDNSKVNFCFLEDRNKELPPPRMQLIELQKRNKSFRKLFYENDTSLFDNLPVYGTGNIYFGKRNLIENGIYMIGDAAGVIAPLAGDGIGIAMESGKLLAALIYKKRKNNLTKEELDFSYKIEWRKVFIKRMKTAKIIQYFILRKTGRLTSGIILNLFPSLLPYLVNSTRNSFRNEI